MRDEWRRPSGAGHVSGQQSESFGTQRAHTLSCVAGFRAEEACGLFGVGYCVPMGMLSDLSASAHTLAPSVCPHSHAKA